MRREFTSDEFRATLKDGLLAVYSLRERQLVETKIEGGKASQRTVGPSSDDPLGRLAAEMSKWPVFAATAAEDDEGWFHLDIDAGFQRWIGMKPAPLPKSSSTRRRVRNRPVFLPVLSAKGRAAPKAAPVVAARGTSSIVSA